MDRPCRQFFTWLLSLILVANVARAADGNLAAYLEKGGPSPDRTWLGDQYQELVALLEAGGIPLPREKDLVLGPVFERMVNPENLEVLESETLPLGVRLQTAAAYAPPMQAIFLRYLQESGRDESAGREFARVTAYLLRLMGTTYTLGDAFFATLSEEQRTDARMAGLAQMKNGIVKVFSGTLTFLKIEEFAASPHAVIVAEAFAEQLPRVRGALPDSVASEFRATLGRLRDAASNADLRTALSAAHAALEPAASP